MEIVVKKQHKHTPDTRTSTAYKKFEPGLMPSYKETTVLL